MNQNRQAVENGFRVAAVVLLFVAAALPVGLHAQQGTSLADAARQARAERQAQPKADGEAQRIADQLAEEQTGGDAPAGFKIYKAEGYTVLVPTPFIVVAHDEAGVIVAGNQNGSTRLYMLVGNPVVQHWGNNDDAFHDAAAQFTRLYAPTSTCTRTAVANHEAYQCSMAGAKLADTSVSGNATFVKSGDHIYPVFCAAKTDSAERDILNNPHGSVEVKLDAKAALQREERDVQVVWQKCNAVVQSILIQESARPVTAKAGNAEPAVTASNAAAASATGKTGAPTSLAQVAQQLRQAPGTEVLAPAVSAKPEQAAEAPLPPGLKVHAFKYCKGQSNDCYNASIFIPVEAQLVSSDCNQFVFETKVQGSPFLLLAGSANGCSRSANDPGQVRWNQLVLPETLRAPGTSSTISSQGMILEKRPAVITTMGFRKGLTDWIGKRAEVESNGVQLVVGCMAPREHFADGDSICSALIQSLRLP